MCRWIFANGVIWKSPSQLEMWNLCFPRSSGRSYLIRLRSSYTRTNYYNYSLGKFKSVQTPSPSPLMRSGWRRVMGDMELVLHLTYELSPISHLWHTALLPEECPRVRVWESPWNNKQLNRAWHWSTVGLVSVTPDLWAQPNISLMTRGSLVRGMSERKIYTENELRH